MVASIDQINDQLKNKARAKSFKVPPQAACLAAPQTADIPDIRPCMELRWGDSEKDQFETNDEEVLLLVASNPYTNVVFKDLTVVNVTVLWNSQDVGKVPELQLPDGSTSVEVVPSNIIHFGHLEPLPEGYKPPTQPDPDEAHDPDCKTPATPLDPTCVARELVLISRGAKKGDYQLELEYSFSVEFLCPGDDLFSIELVRS